MLALGACAHPGPVLQAPPPPAPAPLQARAAAPAEAKAPEAVPPGAPAEGPDLDALRSRLTLEQKVGQLMMVGFGGQVVDAQIAALVQGRQVGGVCMFKRNIASAEQVARLNDAVRALLEDGVPPFIAVDQEGGNVVRLSEAMVILPGNMALGATRSSELAYLAGREQAEDLRRLGFNMNLAPVLDVNVNPRNPVIGIRSFSDQAELVAELGWEFIRGQQEADVATVAKHFPGHGAADADSHKMLPLLPEGEAQLWAQLLPFRVASRNGLDGMMTAHVAAPRVTGDEVPATLSDRLLGELLRRRMQFDGLVLTDELEMEAIASRYGVGRAAVLAVQAGADMVLVPWRVERKTEVYEALLEAARSGELPAARLEDAVRRVLALKAKRGLFRPLPGLAQRLADVGRRREVALDIARASLTLLRTDPAVFPLVEGRKVAVITAEASLGQAVRARAPDATVLEVPAFPSAARAADLKLLARQVAQTSDVVVVGVVNSRQVELAVNAALVGRPVIAVVLGAPYLAAQLDQARVVLATYSYRESATEAAAAALFGEAGTPGRLPVSLPRFPFGYGLDARATRASTFTGAR